MSIFKKLLTNNTSLSKSIIKNSVIAGTIIFSGFGQDVMAKGKSYVAVEPLAVSYTHLTLPTITEV